MGYADAKAAIQSAEALIGSADDKTKAKFYFLKGQALYANGTGSGSDTDEAIASFNKVKDIESNSGKSKYTSEVEELKTQMLSSFLTSANTAWQGKSYVVSSEKFDRAYRMSPKDTLYLYYAASSAVNAQDYDRSLKLYEELRDLGLKSGTHIVPQEKLTESKLPLIKKMLADIYIYKGADAKAAIQSAEALIGSADDKTK